MDIKNLIFADFHNSDVQGRVRLNTIGTLADLEARAIKLHPGLILNLTDYDELSVKGVVEYSEEEKIWVAKIDWKGFSRVFYNVPLPGED